MSRWAWAVAAVVTVIAVATAGKSESMAAAAPVCAGMAAAMLVRRRFCLPAWVSTAAFVLVGAACGLVTALLWGEPAAREAVRSMIVTLPGYASLVAWSVAQDRRRAIVLGEPPAGAATVRERVAAIRWLRRWGIDTLWRRDGGLWSTSVTLLAEAQTGWEAPELFLKTLRSHCNEPEAQAALDALLRLPAYVHEESLMRAGLLREVAQTCPGSALAERAAALASGGTAGPM